MNTFKELSRTWKTKNGQELSLSLDYSREEEEIKNVSVTFFNREKNLYVDLTELFETEPFASFIDNLPFDDYGYVNDLKKVMP